MNRKSNKSGRLGGKKGLKILMRASKRAQFFRNSRVKKNERRVRSEVSPKRMEEHTGGDMTTRMHQQEVVALLSQIALASLDLDLHEYMQEVAVFLARTLEVHYAKILELDPSGDTLTLRAGYGWKKAMIADTTKFKSKSSVAGYTLLSKKPVVIRDLREERSLSGLPHLRIHGVKSGISVIIPGGKSPYGVLGVYSKTLKTFTDDDLNFLQSIANVLALCFERRKAEIDRQKTLRNLEFLAEAGFILSSSLDYKQTLDLVAKTAISHIADWVRDRHAD